MNSNAEERLFVGGSILVEWKTHVGNRVKRTFFGGRKGQLVDVRKSQTREFVLYPVRQVMYTRLYFSGRLIWQQGV